MDRIERLNDRISAYTYCTFGPFRSYARKLDLQPQNAHFPEYVVFSSTPVLSSVSLLRHDCPTTHSFPFNFIAVLSRKTCI